MQRYPCTQPLLIQKLVQMMPNRHTQIEIQSVYNKLLLCLCEVIPEAEEKLLNAIIDKLLLMDVEIKKKKR